jgi:hypothetical protein
VATDDDALEDLDTGAVAFDDLDVDLDRVTGAEGGDVGLHRRLVEFVETLHGASLSSPVPQVIDGSVVLLSDGACRRAACG